MTNELRLTVMCPFIPFTTQIEKTTKMVGPSFYSRKISQPAHSC